MCVGWGGGGCIYYIKISRIVRVKILRTANMFLNYLRNEFNFWNVHGIMNTSGLLQSNFASVHGILNISGLLQSK